MYLHGTFKNRDNDTIEVQIRSNKGQDEIIIGENHNSEVFFGDDPLEITQETDDLFQTIIKKSCTVNLVTSIYLADLFAANEEDVTISVFKNNTLIFKGFVEPNSYSQPWAYHLETFTLNCIDYLSTLQYKYPTDTKTYEQLLADNDIYSFTYYITDILSGFSNNILYDGSKTVGNDSALDKCGISYNVFLGDSEDDVMTNEEILNELLQYLNLHIIQEGDKFYIYDWKSIENNSVVWQAVSGTNTNTPSSTNINVTKAMYSSDSTSLSMDEVYNQIQVKCDLEDTEDLVESPLDDDTLDSKFDRSQLYMTEYWTYGDSPSSFYAFRDLITSDMANDPTSTDPNTDYDQWGVDDWYVKWLYNPKWTITFHNTDLDSMMETTTEAGKTIYINQFKVMKMLRENNFMPALVNVGHLKNPLGHNSHKRLNSSLDTNNYLVISVNGLETDTDAAATQIDTDNQYAAGTNGILSYNSSEVTTLSPSSNDVTNYLVFSGKMILAPHINKTGRVDGSLLFTGDFTFQQTLDFTNMYMYGMGKVRYKDGYAYYTQEFWEAEKTTDTPEPNKTEKWSCPFIEIDENRKYQYNYCEDGNGGGSTIDTYDKLPILECQFKVGDKYLVEITDNRNGQKPLYEWLTEDECPYLNDDDGNPTNVKKTTFTLGIDPEFGDYIIGKKYELANTVDGRISDEVGTAIPITNADALAGPIEFKIMGLVNVTWNNLSRRHPTLFRHTRWYNDYVNLLAHCANIWIEDFGVKIISDNGGMDVKSQSQDLIYLSDEVRSYLKKKDDIDFKINTMITTQEAVDLGVKSTVSHTNVINTTTNLPIESITDNQGNTDRAERIYINEYWNYYNQPKIIIETDLHNSINDFNTFKTLTFNGFGKMLITSMTHNLKNNSTNITCRQV